MCFSRHQVACLKQVSQREEFDWLKTSRNVYCPGHWVLYSNLVNQIIRGMVPTKKINREIPVQAKCIAVTRLEDCPIQYTRYISPDEEQLPVDSMQKTLHGSIIDSVQHAQELITWQFGEHHDSRAYTGELYMGIPTGVWKAYRFYDCDLGDYVPNGVITFSPDAQQYAEELALSESERRQREEEESEERSATSRTCGLCTLCAVSTAVKSMSASSIPGNKAFGSALAIDDFEHL